MSLGPNCECKYCGQRYYLTDGHICYLSAFKIARKKIDDELAKEKKDAQLPPK